MIKKHQLFFVYLLLFLLVGLLDLFNLDRVLYEDICRLVHPKILYPCPTYYDIPIWQVYLSLAILAALYHVHDEVRTTNRHLSTKK